MSERIDEQVETQVEHLQGGYLAHVFSSCDATLARAPFVVELAEKTYLKQSTTALMSMAGALLGIGKRSRELNAAALKVALKIGPIDFDPDGRCEPMDVAKHLTSNYIERKRGL